MVRLIFWLIIICGFIYGASYLRIFEPYNQNDSVPVGFYILSFQWWNVKFNWSKDNDDSLVTICVKLPTFEKGIKYIEHYLVFDKSGVSYRRFDLF